MYHDKDGTGLYYIVGEGQKSNPDLSACFNLYSSPDWAKWTLEGCVLRNQDVVAPGPKPTMWRIERPKILRCPGTGKFIMWFHCDTPDFSIQSVGVLTSNNITGPYTFASPCFQPDGLKSYDMGTFVDGATSSPYLVRSVENAFAGISAMNRECSNVTGIVSKGPQMEGLAIMRDSNGTLHMAGSHLTGWAPNPAQFVTTQGSTLNGAVWINNYNPSGSPTTFNTQSTFIFPYVHADGHTTYVWMADRWNDAGPGGLDNSTYVWLPLAPPAPGKTQWTLTWYDEWKLKDF